MVNSKKKGNKKLIKNKLTKKKVWPEYSKKIRQKYADDEGMVSCVTCGVRKHWKEMQAGHWISGRHNSILFDDRNCHPQCYHCNIGLKSNPIKYYHFMLDTYGQEIMDELEALDGLIIKLDLEKIMEESKKGQRW